MDRQLVARIQNNDQQAMKLLYQRYVGILMSVCHRYVPSEDDVKDVLQNSFVKIFTSLHSFKFHKDDSLKAYMIKVVVNESLNFLRSQRKLQFVGYEMLIEEPSDEEVDAALMAAYGVISQSGAILIGVNDLAVGHKAKLYKSLETVTDTAHQTVTVVKQFMHRILHRRIAEESSDKLC